MTEITRKIK